MMIKNVVFHCGADGKSEFDSMLNSYTRELKQDNWHEVINNIAFDEEHSKLIKKPSFRGVITYVKYT